MNTQRSSILAIAVVALFGVSVAHAAVIRGGEHYVLERDSSIDGDGYFTGNELFLYGSTTGDLIALGSTVDMQGAVTDDALVLGGELNIAGNVGGDVRVAGGVVTLRGSTTEDVIAFGGTVIIDRDAHVGGNVLVYADELVVSGTVQGGLEAPWTRTTLIEGTILGPVQVSAQESVSIIGEAHLASDISYRAPREAFIPQTVTIEGELTYLEGMPASDGFHLTGFLVKMLMGVVAAVLLMVLFPVFARRASGGALADNGLIALKGLGLMAFIPIVVFVMMLTVLGMIPALIIGIGYLLWLVVAAALAPVLAGALLARVLKREDAQNWAWASLGAITLSIIAQVAFVGWLLALIVYLAAFGTIGSLLYTQFWQRRKGETSLHATASEPAALNHDTAPSETDTEETKTPSA